MMVQLLIHSTIHTSVFQNTSLLKCLQISDPLIDLLQYLNLHPSWERPLSSLQDQPAQVLSDHVGRSNDFPMLDWWQIIRSLGPLFFES